MHGVVMNKEQDPADGSVEAYAIDLCSLIQTNQIPL